MDKTGAVAPLRDAPLAWVAPRFSPDGSRIALQILNDANAYEIWIYAWQRDSLSRLTSAAGRYDLPVWTPDGARLVFSVEASDGPRQRPVLHWMRADGSGQAELMLDRPAGQRPGSWHPNGRIFAYSESTGQRTYDIMILPVGGNEKDGWEFGTPYPFVNGSFSENEPVFAPDGRWLAYTSDESGQPEVYVRAFPGPSGRIPISDGGGQGPVWSKTRRELLYAGRDGRVMSSAYSVTNGAFSVEQPQPWSQRPIAMRNRFGSFVRPFDLHPDGQRIVMAPLRDSAVPRNQATLVVNFLDEVRRLTAPPGTSH